MIHLFFLGRFVYGEITDIINNKYRVAMNNLLKRIDDYFKTNAFFSSLILAFFSSLPITTRYLRYPLENGNRGFIAFTQFLSASFEGVGSQSGFIFFLLFFFYYFVKKQFKSLSPSTMMKVSAWIFSLIFVLGAHLATNGSLFIVVSNPGMILWTCILLTGYYFIFIHCLGIVFYALDRMGEQSDSSGGGLFERHPFLVSSLVLFFCWLPRFISFFPGTVVFDGLVQLNNYIGRVQWGSHHPVFSTWVMGTCVSLGRTLFHSDNAGVFLYTSLQSALMISSVSMGICYLRKWNASVIYQKAVLAFFALTEVWSSFSYTFIKDTSFMIAYFWYFILLLDLALDEDSFSKKKWMGLAVATAFVCLLRNNGVYNIFLAIPCLFILFKNVRIKLSSMMLSICILYLLFAQVFVPMMGIKKGSLGEALSIPFQQTARYVKYHGDEVTEEEKEAINAVLEYDELAARYDPEISDPVKKTTKNIRSNRQRLTAYFKVWFQQFLKHPDVYVTATACNTYGYFYPMKSEYAIFYNKHETSKRVDKGDFHFTMSEQLKPIRNAIISFRLMSANLPGIGLLYMTGFWDLVLFVFTIYLFHRNKKVTLMTVPLWLTVLVCLASPVNAYYRYLIPNIMVMPFFMAWVIWKRDELSCGAQTKIQKVNHV